MAKKSRTDGAEHIVRMSSKEVSVTRDGKERKACGCCSKRYVGLPVIGAALFAVGALLGVGYFSVRSVTASISLTENSVPSCVTGGLLVLNGINTMILFKRRPRCLIISSIILTVVGALFCFAGAMHTLSTVSPMISSFDRCQYFTTETTCKCFHRSELRQVSYIFRGAKNCKVIQYTLSNMVYGISGIYGAGLAVCLIAAVMESRLLCPKRRSKLAFSRSDGDGKCMVSSRQSQTSQTNLTLSCSEAELVSATCSDESHSAPTSGSSSQRPSRQEGQSSTYTVHEMPCQHYVSIPRRDFCMNFESSNTRHDPPPPYTE
ncbi:predicted protein [Nematostella vectensis]|uniref:Uncharacterized protein n=1 Tax=Nematostella vectensis TaxID=45351 RepID=A7S4D7_NEMVE|nr:uncharacterized protein LOC5513280 [Nematostella vectensis]EDO41457.1 predicted protein [Nematostella vectensis]|eukprot:XP_001633520.1 predicted protein [Nematostella vectensis]